MKSCSIQPLSLPARDPDVKPLLSEMSNTRTALQGQFTASQGPAGARSRVLEPIPERALAVVPYYVERDGIGT